MSRETTQTMGKWTQRRMLLGKWARQRIHILTIIGLLVLVSAAFLTPLLRGAGAKSSEQFTSGDTWTTYGGDNNHDGFNGSETVISASSAHTLHQKWAHLAGNGISGQPIEANGVVYWGSWDGNMHATNVATNAKIWGVPVGRTTDSQCDPPNVGVASSPTLTTINGQAAIVVGGGDSNVYALNAANGQQIWKRSLGSPPQTFIWDSPTVANGSVYIGTSSFGDCPLVQSKVFQLSLTDGSIQNTFKVVPDTCTGGGIWGSPTFDASTNKLYITTGNSGSCSQAEPYGFAVVELNASDLSFVDAYQLPANQRPGDDDFGSTPTLFMNGSTPMLGVENKNGFFYAFPRSGLSGGPSWSVQVAVNTTDCPQCGDGSIAPAAWDGTALYVGGGKTKISGVNCLGSVRKLNPSNGSFLWEHCMIKGIVVGSVTVAGPSGNEVVAVSEGNTVLVMNASTGVSLAHLSDSKLGSTLYGGPSISEGTLFVGNLDGNLYAYIP